MPSRQEGPGGKRPGSHPARPGGVDAAFDQRGDREGEADGKADIAEIEQRRVDGEADVLQHRVEVPALGRRRIEADEGIRGQQDEQQEGGRNPGLHGEHVGLQRVRQIAPEDGDQRAEQATGSAARASSSLRDCPRRRNICRSAAPANANSPRRSATEKSETTCA